MAREVNAVLGQIMAEQRGIPEAKAEEIVKGMRSANQYQVRYFFFFLSCRSGWLLSGFYRILMHMNYGGASS